MPLEEKPADQPNTNTLLERWSAGDYQAFHVLLERHMGWISNYVHRRLGRDLRRCGETCDFVQEAALHVLDHGPRFVVASPEHFRALLAKIVLNLLRSKHRELFSHKRSPKREMPLKADTTLYLDPPRRPVSRPDLKAEAAEAEEWLRLAILLLRPEDREVIDLHRQGLDDAGIAEQLGLVANTARMRRARAVARLTGMVVKLKSGALDDVLDQSDEA